jgi:hypothetical protein
MAAQQLPGRLAASSTEAPANENYCAHVQFTHRTLSKLAIIAFAILT